MVITEKDLKKIRKKKRKDLTIAEVNALARAENLSYGKYCARHNYYEYMPVTKF